jgi:hypothetical protein
MPSMASVISELPPALSLCYSELTPPPPSACSPGFALFCSLFLTQMHNLLHASFSHPSQICEAAHSRPYGRRRSSCLPSFGRQCGHLLSKPDLANSMTAAAFFLPKDLGHKTCHWLALLLLRFLSRCPFAPAPHFGPCTYCDRALPSPRSHLSPRATLSSGFLPLPICPFLSLYPLM